MRKDISLSQPIFVGRRHEQQAYQQLLTKTTPWVLIITGQGGVGKSTLLHYLAKQTPEDVAVGILDLANESLRTNPLNILSELSWRLASFCAAERAANFEETLAKEHSRLSELSIQAIQQIVASEDANIQQLQLGMNVATLQERQRQVRETIKQAFYHQVDTFHLNRLVIMLDSCEWLNEPEFSGLGQWLMDELLPGIHQRLVQKRRKCSVVIASRMKPPITAIELQDQYNLSLPMLDRADVDDYLAQMGIHDSVLRKRVYDITYGHALAVSIIGALWQEQGEHLFTFADFGQLQAQYNDRALLEFIQERLVNRLKSPFRELTLYGALLRSFDLPMLHAVFPELLPDSEALDIFHQLVRYPYVAILGKQHYAFHDLLREILVVEVREQQPERWKTYHKRALDYLMQNAPSSPDRYYHGIAYNEERGMLDWWNAVQEAQLHGVQEYLGALLQVAHDGTLELSPVARAQRALCQGNSYYQESKMQVALQSYEEALNIFQQAGSMLGVANVLRARGDVQQFRKDMQAALASYEQALALYRQVRDRLGEANVRKAIGDIQQFRDEREAALGSYEQALALYRQVGDRLGEANVRKAIGDIQQFRDEREAALGSYEQALMLFQQIGSKLGEANVLQAMGDVQQFRKDMQAALASYEQALMLFRQIGSKLGEANVLQAMGDVQQFRDEREAALGSYEGALALYQQVGDRLGEANVLQAIGDVQQFRDDLEAALSSYEQALTLFRHMGSRLGEANVRKAMGDVQQFRDEWLAALVSYEQALTLFRQVGDRLGEANVLKTMGDVQQFRGEHKKALASYEQALMLFRQIGSKLGEANVRKAMGDVQQFRDEREAALESYEQALALFRQVGDRLGEANVLRAIGDVQQFRDDLQAALASYEQALMLFRQIGSKLGEANCYLARGRVALQQEDYQSALDLHTNAYHLYQQIGDGYSQVRLLYYRSFVYEATDKQTRAIQDMEEALTAAQSLGLPFIEILQQRLDVLRENV